MDLIIGKNGQPKTISRKKIINYWASEPVRDWRWTTFGEIAFPDVEWLTDAERDVLRPVLERHPEYLQFEISYRHNDRIH